MKNDHRSSGGFFVGIVHPVVIPAQRSNPVNYVAPMARALLLTRLPRRLTATRNDRVGGARMTSTKYTPCNDAIIIQTFED